MKKIILLLLISQAFRYNGFSQQQVPLDEKHHLDSLQQVLTQKSPDSAKAIANYELVEYWKFKDTIKSKSYLQAARKVAGKDPYLNALSSFYQGQYYFAWNKEKASVAFKKATQTLSAFKTRKAYAKLAAAWYNYGLMNVDKQGYDFLTAITLEKAIPNAEKAGKPALLAYFYNQLSTILMNNYQFSKAADYNQKAIGILESERQQLTDLLFAYLSGVSIHCYDKQPLRAWKLLQQAQKLLKPHPESLNYTLYYYNEALYYTTTEAYGKALKSVDEGTLLAKKFNQKQLYSQLFFLRYNIYSQQKKYDQARRVLLDVVREGTLTAKINDRAEIYSELAKVSEKLGDYKGALQWMDRSRDVNDSINANQTKVKINELETKYRSAENLQKITALQAQNKAALLASRNDRLYKLLLGTGCFFLLMLLIGVLFSSRTRRKLATEREINYRRQMSELEQKQQLKVTKAMLDGEELERERVARDLHDGLGGMLAGVKIGLSGWSDTRAGLSEDRDLNRIIGQLDSSVSELRRIARNMVPDTLLKFGLEVAIKDLCEFYMRDGLKITAETFGFRGDIAMNVQLNIYRILQELLSNALKHSGASNILLQCSQNEDTVFITFEDNGVGFDTASLKGKKGMGLDNLKNRVAFLQGKFELHSALGEGTEIDIELKTRADG